MKKKRDHNIEADLRHIMQDDSKFPTGTVTFVEHGKGGDAGAPDTFFAHDRWIPLELKMGPSVVKELRPTQRRWHLISLLLGITTYGATIDGDVVILYELGLSPTDRGSRRTLVEYELLRCNSSFFTLVVLRGAVNKITGY